jgi:GNAT superfamily N-acetyltransferase
VGRRTPRIADLVFRPLTPDLWGRFADWFGSPDSSSDARWCWCAFWRQRGIDWSNSTPESNRALLRGLAEREGPAPGLVALRGDRAVGWVSVGPRETYDRLEHSRVLARVDDRPVWSIVCFVVARGERGRGVATALLDAAVAYAREHGATLVEAYPADTAGGRIPAGSAYGGPLPMFQRAGFELAATRRANAATRPRAIVRRELEGTPGESA